MWLHLEKWGQGLGGETSKAHLVQWGIVCWWFYKQTGSDYIYRFRRDHIWTPPPPTLQVFHHDLRAVNNYPKSANCPGPVRTLLFGGRLECSPLYNMPTEIRRKFWSCFYFIPSISLPIYFCFCIGKVRNPSHRTFLRGGNMAGTGRLWERRSRIWASRKSYPSERDWHETHH